MRRVLVVFGYGVVLPITIAVGISKWIGSAINKAVKDAFDTEDWGL